MKARIWDNETFGDEPDPSIWVKDLGNSNFAVRLQDEEITGSRSAVLPLFRGTAQLTR